MVQPFAYQAVHRSQPHFLPPFFMTYNGCKRVWVTINLCMGGLLVVVPAYSSRCTVCRWCEEGGDIGRANLMQVVVAGGRGEPIVQLVVPVQH